MFSSEKDFNQEIKGMDVGSFLSEVSNLKNGFRVMGQGA